MRRFLVGLALLSCAASPRTPPTTTSGDNAEIVVEGQTLDHHDIAVAVRSISSPEPTGGFESQYPRWVDGICVLVGGFARDDGQFIADRIGEVARGLKLDAGPPGCSPNIFILATGDPAKLIAGLRVKRRGLVTGRDLAVVRAIQKSQDAVRWIGATTMTGTFGEPAQPGPFGLSGRTAPVLQNYDGGSRLVARTQTVLTRETIIVDTRQIEGMRYGQLADYLAFVALAQLNPHATLPGVDTILSLFPRGGAAPAGLTAFDRAYLTGLYQSPPNMVGTIQKDDIESTIDHTLRPKPAAAVPKDRSSGP